MGNYAGTYITNKNCDAENVIMRRQMLFHYGGEGPFYHTFPCIG